MFPQYSRRTPADRRPITQQAQHRKLIGAKLVNEIRVFIQHGQE
jgi:hypothetical protein